MRNQEEENNNTERRMHNIKMSELHLQQKNAFRKLYDSGIDIDYRDPKIMRLICQGVPSLYRAKVWPALIKNVHGITSKYYQMLIKKAAIYIEADASDVIPERSKMINHLKKIEHDIERTYPQLKIFRKDNDQGQTLFNVLTAWTVFREDVGYIQGMSQIAGLLLLELKEIEAFTVFCSMMTTDMLFIYANFDMEEVQFFQHNLEKRLKKGDEFFFMKIKEQGIEMRAYLMNWILTLFTRTMSLDMVSLLWDLLFAYNLCGEILIEVSYFLFQAVKKRLDKNFQPEQLASILKNFKLTDIEAYSVICNIRQFYCSIKFIKINFLCTLIHLFLTKLVQFKNKTLQSLKIIIYQSFLPLFSSTNPQSYQVQHFLQHSLQTQQNVSKFVYYYKKIRKYSKRDIIRYFAPSILQFFKQSPMACIYLLDSRSHSLLDLSRQPLLVPQHHVLLQLLAHQEGHGSFLYGRFFIQQLPYYSQDMQYRQFSILFDFRSLQL